MQRFFGVLVVIAAFSAGYVSFAWADDDLSLRDPWADPGATAPVESASDLSLRDPWADPDATAPVESASDDIEFKTRPEDIVFEEADSDAVDVSDGSNTKGGRVRIFPRILGRSKPVGVEHSDYAQLLADTYTLGKKPEYALEAIGILYDRYIDTAQGQGFDVAQDSPQRDAAHAALLKDVQFLAKEISKYTDQSGAVWPDDAATRFRQTMWTRFLEYEGLFLEEE